MLSKIYYILKFIFYILVNLPRDLRGALLYQKIKRKLKDYDKTNPSLDKVFSQWVKTQPEKPLFHFNDETVTFKQVCQFSVNFIFAKLFH